MKKFLLLITFVSSIAYAQTPATALNFDGTDDYVNVGTDTAFDFTSTSTFTIEAWINPTTTTGNWKVIAARESWTAGLGWVLHTSNDAVIFRTPSGTVQTAALLNIGAWNHVVVVYDASAVTIYVNQVSVASGTLPITSAASQSMYIGARHGNAGTGSTDFHSGDMDELRFWSTARTIVELGANKDCALTGTETDLLSYYNFNQGFVGEDNTAVTTLVSSNASYNGTLTNFTLTGVASNYVDGSANGLDSCTLSTASNALDEAITLFPNPAKNEFYLRNTNTVSLSTATITDINGRIVSVIDLQGMNNTKKVDVANLKSGMYLVTIASNNASVTKKLIIK